MSYQTNSDLIRRRSAFYCNTLLDLQGFIYDIQSQLACKWCSDEDSKVINEILGSFSCAELAITTRYQQVLGDRADDLRNSLEEHND